VASTLGLIVFLKQFLETDFKWITVLYFGTGGSLLKISRPLIPHSTHDVVPLHQDSCKNKCLDCCYVGVQLPKNSYVTFLKSSARSRICTRNTYIVVRWHRWSSRVIKKNHADVSRQKTSLHFVWHYTCARSVVEMSVARLVQSASSPKKYFEFS